MGQEDLGEWDDRLFIEPVGRKQVVNVLNNYLYCRD
jgi:hypothetical protein